MDASPRSDGAVRATSVPVVIVVLAHAAISTLIIALVDPDVPDLRVYWLISVLGPSMAWALLVLGRAAVWRRRSAFWLGASAGIVVLLAFLSALLIFIGDISARGIPLALLYSSWVLLGCAIIVALVLRALGRHADRPADAPLREEPGAVQPLGDAPSAAEPDAHSR